MTSFTNGRFFRPAIQCCRAAMAFLWMFLFSLDGAAQPFELPTSNRAIYENGGDERFFVGTVGKTWKSGTFGCVRSEGWQIHEGLDIRCVQRDRRGEPVDPVMATADGLVVYVNAKPSLSNYGNYIVIRHSIEGMEVYSLYAHLREIRAGLSSGQQVKRGEQIGVMGRTANTREGISKDRAHVHFELNFLVNDRYAAWHNKFLVGERNDHGCWNGQNLNAIDTRLVLLEQRRLGAGFSLVKFIRSETELCRVFIRAPDFQWLHRYAPLVTANPLAAKKGVAGYEVALDFNGVPIEMIPRAAEEVRKPGKVVLLSVNELEQRRNPGRRLVIKKGTRWELTSHGQNLASLIAF